MGSKVKHAREEVVKLSDSIWVAIIAFAGTLIGTVGGIMASSKLTAYRIEQLEKKVDKHNALIERTFRLEETCSLLGEKINVVNHRIDDLERGGKS
jgi:hypothetical protein